MAQAVQTVDNSLIKGLITEATGLNFPENAVTETYDCVFDSDGSIYRRKGLDFELSYTTKEIDREDKVVQTYLWKNVAGDGDVTLLVAQVGNTLYFYEINSAGNFSQGAISDTATLTAVSGAPGVSTIEAQFSDGNGYLFVTHPYIEPMKVSYDAVSQTITTENITIQIRDFEGVTPSYAIDFRPTSTYAALPVNHQYNLQNQGWFPGALTLWDTNNTTMPSLADVLWRFRDTVGGIDLTAATIAKVIAGNSRAPAGHFILTLSNQDRNTAAGLTGVTPTTTGFQRPSTSAFFAGRMFYAGINTSGFNSKIYFTQIIEKDDQYGKCYQVNDPSAEDLFDLLPSDGGVISIPEAGTIYKLFTVPGGLCVFAANGVWFITGNQGIGFTANDYSQQKIANITTLTASSFVNVGGFPCWWNAEGIYLMTVQNASPVVQSITNDKIRTFYQEIPLASKRYARGFWNATDGHIRWLYRDTASQNLNNIYEFNRILNFNTLTGAFYPWTIPSTAIKVHSLVSADLISRYITVEDVVDGSGTLVVDDLGEQVIAFSDTGAFDPQFDKYFVSYLDGSSNYQFTFADRIKDDHVDWISYDDVGVNYDSYFITGFKIKGAAMRRFQNNWVKILSRTQFFPENSYYFQAIWDYATTGDNTGRWSVNQLVEHDSNNRYSNLFKRLKVRGHGTAMQFKVSSVDDQPFDIVGWSTIQSVNERA